MLDPPDFELDLSDTSKHLMPVWRTFSLSPNPQIPMTP